ncbi:hypothetical protein A5706_01355 [Mycobacterium sp. E796]|nr:hypothetical protein A5706_01355 [Mycobacterium sp. E796]
MSGPQTLNVDYDELMKRADEIEAPIPGMPMDNPQPPCLVAMVLTANNQLGYSASNIRQYLRTGIEREWPKLAENMRKAAKAYEEVDENAATAINSGTSMSVSTRALDEDLDQVVLTETQVAESPFDQYQDLKQRAWDVENGDRGVSFDNFAEAWTTYSQKLLSNADRFRPFENYDGDAASALEDAMDAQRQWLVQMANLCANMATQARTVASAQRWCYAPARLYPNGYQGEHIWMDEKTGHGYIWGPVNYNLLVAYEKEYDTYTPQQQTNMRYAWADMQAKSDWVMAEYERRAALPLAPINPQRPPYVKAAPEPGSGGEQPPDDNPDDTPSDGSPYDAPTGGSGGSSAGAADTPNDQTPTDPPVYPWTAPSPSKGAGVKPASLGGAGGGMPSMPLQPAVEAEAAPRPTGAAPSAGLVGAAPGGRAAMGGGMGGMPMGGQGQNQNGKQGKRIPTEDEALYKEDRPWTAPVIGNRRRNDLPEGEHDAA